MTTLLNSLTRLKRREQDSVRRQRSLLRVSETLVAGASNIEHFYNKVLSSFGKVVILNTSSSQLLPLKKTPIISIRR